MQPIPFNKPFMTGKELWYISQAHAAGHLSGDGSFTKRCNAWLIKRTGAREALLTNSCTAGLEMAAILSGVEPGDEVIMPSFTFVSTANAFVLRGAIPIFVDIRPDTLNLDERLLEEKVTERTRAIVPVHYAGVGCDMERIGEIAARHGAAVVEDNAHGLFGSRAGRLLGTRGAMSTLSFHETKNFSCGEGGALVINDPRFITRAEIVREKGTNRKRFFRGEVDKYTWVDIGSSFLPSDMLAAYLLGQLEKKEKVLASRRRVYERYARELPGWASRVGARLPTIPPECESSYHMFYVLLPDPESRAALIAHLKSRGILSVFHYQPLHLSEMARRWGGRIGDCPVTEQVSDRLLRLPFYTN